MDYLDQYLVKLGFDTPEPELRHLKDFLHRAEAAVDTHTSGMTRNLLKAETGIIGGFLGISGAIVGMTEKVSMADQSYRLMGMRMLMTQDSARTLDIVTKTLGATLEEVIWDPELHARAARLAQDINTVLKPQLGPDFENRMRQIRDVRAEFGRLGVAWKFLEMEFVSDVFKKLNVDPSQLTQFVDRIEAKIPEFADKLSTYAIPVLTGTWKILQDIVEIGKMGAVVFTNFVGALSGDDSIEGTVFSLDKLAKAFDHVIGWADRFVHYMLGAETALAHFAVGSSLVLDHRWKEAAAEFKEAAADAKQVGADVVDDVKGRLDTAKHPATQGAGESKEKPDTFGNLIHGLVPAEGNSAAKHKVLDWLGIHDTDTTGQPESAANSSLLGVIPTRTQPDWIDKLFNTSVARKAADAAKNQSKSPAAVAAKTSNEDFVSSLADAIKQHEGYYQPGTHGFPKGSHSYRDNNPGNLRSDPASPEIHPIASDDGYLVFKTYDDGLRAEMADVRAKIKQGLNSYEFFDKYAPAADHNKPRDYATDVASKLGIDPNVPLQRYSDGYTPKAGDDRMQARLRDWQPAELQSAPAVASPATTISITVGDIKLGATGADPRDIHAAVAQGVQDGVERGLRSQTQSTLAQISPPF